MGIRKMKKLTSFPTPFLGDCHVRFPHPQEDRHQAYRETGRKAEAAASSEIAGTQEAPEQQAASGQGQEEEVRSEEGRLVCSRLLRRCTCRRGRSDAVRPHPEQQVVRQHLQTRQGRVAFRGNELRLILFTLNFGYRFGYINIKNKKTLLNARDPTVN